MLLREASLQAACPQLPLPAGTCNRAGGCRGRRIAVVASPRRMAPERSLPKACSVLRGAMQQASRAWRPNLSLAALLRYISSGVSPPATMTTCSQLAAACATPKAAGPASRRRCGRTTAEGGELPMSLAGTAAVLAMKVDPGCDRKSRVMAASSCAEARRTKTVGCSFAPLMPAGGRRAGKQHLADVLDVSCSLLQATCRGWMRA